MARIDFYVVAGSGDRARQHFACRLAEKAYRHNHSVHIEVADPASARVMDEMLWTFRDGSFVPHDLSEPGASEAMAPVTIGMHAADQRQPDLVINLTNEIPEQPDSFARIAEIVSSDNNCKARSRQKFAAYREEGHTLETHKI
jgi:DNA polymerase III subunit chi